MPTYKIGQYKVYKTSTITRQKISNTLRRRHKHARQFRTLLKRTFLTIIFISIISPAIHKTRTIIIDNLTTREAQATTTNTTASPALSHLIPALRPVCACETKGNPKATPTHYNKQGQPLIGISGDIGICQINPNVHKANAEAMGLDLYTEADNITYANYLYNLSGLTPWNSSKHCWATKNKTLK